MKRFRNEHTTTMEPEQVVKLAEELARAVAVNLDTFASQATRMEAYMACERFKEMSPLCAQVGLYLASGPQFTAYVKHFGLQLMENTVKCKWNQITQQEKVFIKENAMKLLSEGVICADPAQGHIKDALSKIVVEMVKREWPQQWTTLLSELSDACGKGTTQTELVLLIFLRLVEDVALLQTIESNQRRKDIYQALTVSMTEIFEFFLRLIELHVNSFRTATQIGDHTTAAKHSRVVQTVLLTLTGFVEWVSITHIVASNGKLLNFLCLLLLDPCFRIPAAECLSQILNRKGTLKERVPLKMLFQEEMIGSIYRAATQFEAGGNYEAFYQFLKKLIGVLAGLANQLTANKTTPSATNAALPATGGGIVTPAAPPPAEDHFFAVNKGVAFPTYLETVLHLTRHPSLTLAHGSALIWVQLLKHDQVARDSKFLEYVPKVIETIGPRILKVSYPSTRPTEVTMDGAVFASLDYDGDEEFTTFFYRCRTDLLEVFRQGTLIAPLVTFAYCEQWMNVRLMKARGELNTTCSIQDPVYLEWEALVAVLDGVMSRILLVTERPSVASGLRLLEACLAIDTQDPLIYSIILSAISALFVFLSMSSCQMTANNCVAMSGVSLLPKVLDKVFSALVFTDPTASAGVVMDASKMIWSKAVKNLRRHAASLMVKLAIKYPLLLLPIFEQIHSTVQGLLRQPNRLSRGEQVTLQEALLIIANNYCDYEKQTIFVSQVIAEGRDLWMQVTPIIKTVDGFVKYTGLHADGVANEAKEFVQHRSNISHALNIILGVIKRSSWPDDPDRAARGNFVVGLTESANPICRNPATPHFVPLLEHVLTLFRVLNELHKPEALLQIGPSFRRTVHNLQECERRLLLGAPPVTVDPMDPTEKKPQTNADKMQAYLVALYDNCCHLLGSSGPSLGRDLYQLQGIADALIHSVFSNLEHLPDHRLRIINRIFIKPFVYSCPPVFHDTVLLPVVGHVAPFMLNRLTVRWKYIQELYQKGELTEDGNDDTQEVVEDMLNRLMTREYLDVLKVALVGSAAGVSSPVADTNGNTGAGGGGGAEMAMDHDELSMDGQGGHNLTRAAQSAMASEVISELGGKLLKNPATCQPIVLTILR